MKVRRLSAEEEQQIIKDYNLNMKRGKILRKYKITEYQLILIIKSHINNTAADAVAVKD